MFKKEKDLAERSRTLLKNKEARNLRSEIAKQFHVTEEDICSIIEPKASISCTKLASKTLLYSVDNVPLFFDANSRNALFPTVFALWKCPSMLRHFVIHEHVSHFVLKGADLMLPGVSVINDAATLSKNEKVCIRVRGNPMPIAVGTSEVDAAYLSAMGRRGRGVAVLHYFGDALYMSQVHIVPNSGFQLGQVSSIEDEEGENASGENDASDNDGGVEGTEEEGEHMMTVKSGTEDNTSPSDTPIDVSNMHISEANDEPSPPSAEDMDALLLVCLLRALKYIVSVDELPLLVSSLWNTLMRCAPADGPKPDIKASSYKKVTPFLLHCQSSGLLTLSCKDGVYSVTSYERKHPFYTMPHVKVVDVDSFRQFVKHGPISSEPEPLMLADKLHGPPGTKLKISRLYKIPKNIRSIMGSAHGEYGEYLTNTEITAIVMEYSKLNTPDNSNGAILTLPLSNPLVSFLKLRPTATDAPTSPCTATPALPAPPMTLEQEDEDEGADTAIPANDSNYIMVAGTLISTQPPQPPTSQSSQAPAPKKWKPISLPSKTSLASIQQDQSKTVSTTATSTGTWARAATKQVPEEPISGVVEISKGDLVAAVRDKCVGYYLVSYPSGECDIRSVAPAISFDVERRQGNKLVTKIRGLESFGLDYGIIAKELQKKFACSVAVSEVPGRPKDKEIVTQGNWIADLEVYFTNQHHIPKTCMSSKLPSGVKAKKK